MENITVKEAIEVIVDPHYSFNRTTPEFKMSNIFRLIYPDNEFCRLIDHIKNDIEKIDDNYTIYYPKNILEVLNVLQSGSKSEVAKNVDDLKLSFSYNDFYSRFNWKNFNILKENNLLSVMSEFCTKFRGDVLAVHKVYNNKYTIIETKKDNDDIFYIYENEQVNTFSYSTFEEALFAAMVPERYVDGMIAIYKYSQ
jgi:hypothetical protein